jgi:chemotaxis protein MotB
MARGILSHNRIKCKDMRRRRNCKDEPQNHERWLVSYADFITLLFAFFVVMYAVSSVNEGKYRVLSNTLTDAFHEPTRSTNPIQIGELRRSSGPLLGDAPSYSALETTQKDGPENAEAAFERQPRDGFETSPNGMAESKRLGYIAGSLASVLEPYMDEKLVNITHNGLWVEVDMKSQLLFTSGSARLSRPALRLLGDVSRVLKPLPNSIHVEGYTDNVPISTTSFPSNWELSAARAASVVHLFTRAGIEPQRLAAIGFGEHRPIDNNDTEAGRQNNRRVSIIILAGKGREDEPSTRALRGVQP